VIEEIESRTQTRIDVGTRIPFVFVLPEDENRSRSKKDKMYQYALESSRARETNRRLDRVHYLEKEFVTSFDSYFSQLIPAHLLSAIFVPVKLTIQRQDTCRSDLRSIFNPLPPSTTTTTTTRRPTLRSIWNAL